MKELEWFWTEDFYTGVKRTEIPFLSTVLYVRRVMMKGRNLTGSRVKNHKDHVREVNMEGGS